MIELAPLTIHTTKNETIQLSKLDNGNIKLLHEDQDYAIGTPLVIANVLEDLYSGLEVNQFMDWYKL